MKWKIQRCRADVTRQYFRFNSEACQELYVRYEDEAKKLEMKRAPPLPHFIEKVLQWIRRQKALL